MRPLASRRSTKCRTATDKPGKVVNLQPLQPPKAPGNVRLTSDGVVRCTGYGDSGCKVRWHLRWGDVTGEDGYRVYESRWRPKAPRGSPRGACYPARFTDPVLVATLDPDTTHLSGIWDDVGVGDFNGTVGSKFFVASFNNAGESVRVASNPLDGVYGVPLCR